MRSQCIDSAELCVGTRKWMLEKYIGSMFAMVRYAVSYMYTECCLSMVREEGRYTHTTPGDASRVLLI